MPQRRTPGGQGPGARGGREVRGAGRRTGARTGGRAEPARFGGARGGASRAAGTADSPRAGNRPGAVRRPAAAGAAKRTRAPQPGRLTGRAAVLCMLLIGLLLAYAYPVRVYLSQQNEIDQLETRQAAQRAWIEHLSGELDKWNDDEYVKAQARGRLLMRMPGDNNLVVIDKDRPKADSVGNIPAPGAGNADPWYGKLWSSIRAADRGAS